MRRAPRYHTAVLPHHQHPRRRLGGWCGPVLPLAHPGGGASSLGISTTAAWSPAVRASAGDADVTAVAAAVAAATNAASCCGPVATTVARGGSPVAALLPATRGALDDCRLIGTDMSDLSALAGARAGTTDAILRTRKRKNEHLRLEIKGAQGKYYLPQTAKALLPLPRGFRRCHYDARRRRRSARRRPRGARRCTSGARGRLLH
jgi:hypothetical protein